MKALRERMRKSLTIDAGLNSGGASPHATTSDGSKPVCKVMGRKEIQVMTEAKFAKLYKLKRQVMESTNSGMQVLFAERLADKAEVVIKIRDRAVSFKRASDERDWRITTELQLNMPKTEQLCQFLEIIETKENYYVVMEKVDGRDLFEQLALERDGLKVIHTREILWQILTALQLMHGSGRIHKDLKLENVMVDMDSPKRRTSMVPGGGDEVRSPKAKLIDFDTVINWEPSSPKARDVLGTDGYIAPEAYGGQYSPASDIYCVGVIMYKLLTRKFPFRADIFDDQPGENWVGSPAMARIQDRLREEKIDFSRPPLPRLPYAADLCSRMLAFDPVERPTAEEAMAHKWFMLKPEDLSPKTPRRSSSSFGAAPKQTTFFLNTPSSGGPK